MKAVSITLQFTWLTTGVGGTESVPDWQDRLTLYANQPQKPGLTLSIPTTAEDKFHDLYICLEGECTADLHHAYKSLRELPSACIQLGGIIGRFDRHMVNEQELEVYMKSLSGNLPELAIEVNADPLPTLYSAKGGG